MPDLMELPPSALAHAELRARLKIPGHAAQPGTGPEGETCGTCQHRRSVAGGKKNFSKCALSLARWTRGPASDIRMKDPACAKWTAAGA